MLIRPKQGILDPQGKAVERALRGSAKMQCDDGHPRGCMVALGVMSAPSPELLDLTATALAPDVKAVA